LASSERKPSQPKQEKAVFSKGAGDSGSSEAISGMVLPSPLGYCSVVRTLTSSALAAESRTSSLGRMAGIPAMAGTNFSCMSITATAVECVSGRAVI
jgi:uncharacterized protein (UPF0261 family)